MTESKHCSDPSSATYRPTTSLFPLLTSLVVLFQGQRQRSRRIHDLSHLQTQFWRRRLIHGDDVPSMDFFHCSVADKTSLTGLTRARRASNEHQHPAGCLTGYNDQSTTEHIKVVRAESDVLVTRRLEKSTAVPVCDFCDCSSEVKTFLAAWNHCCNQRHQTNNAQ